MSAPGSAGSGPPPDPDWWRDHFSGLMLELWEAIVPPGRAEEDADFLERRLDLRPGDSALDVPCGEGRVAIALAARGFRMTGIDISPGMIAAARRNAEARGVTVELREGDMRDLPADGTFDAAYCWADSFGYMDDAANAAYLASVHGALRSRGLFAMEVQMLAELLETRFVAAGTGSAGGISVAVRRTWDRAAGRLTVDYDLDRAGASQSYRASYRIYTLAELLGMVRHAGFRVEECGDQSGAAFDPRAAPPSTSLRLVCRALH